tara:strand:+ start:1484 stop:1714 length:231 start_codon:yes stop_codon:yes gene_type:complete
MSSLFELNLDIDKEYVPMINDVIRMAVIQIVAQMLFYFNDPKKNPLWSLTFAQTLIYILIGVISYWLIMRKIIIIN